MIRARSARELGRLAPDLRPRLTLAATLACQNTKQIRLLTSIQFFQGKVKAFETPLVEAYQLSAPDRKAAVFQFDVPLSQLKPGLYTCQVTVIDDAAGTFAFPRLALLVKNEAAKPATAAGGE